MPKPIALLCQNYATKMTSMKHASFILIAFLLVCIFVPVISISTVSAIHPEGNASQSQQVILNDSAIRPVADSAGSMIRFFDDKNQSTTLIVDSKMNLSWMTIGTSTIVNPPIEIKDKIDANLLNLTGLLVKGYLHDNQTGIIFSLSSGYVGGTLNLTKLTSLPVNVQALYQSQHAYPQMNFLAAQLNYSTMLELAASPQVNHIWLDRKFEASLDQSVRIIKDPTQWAQIEASYHRTITGSGIKIAILDTGIDATHPDFLFSDGTSKIAETVSFTGESTADGFGHGTHVASIAAGTGAASAGQYTGVAPGALLLNVKILNNYGDGQESWITSGIQWAVDHNAKILSMSFGTDTNSDGTDPLSTAVNWASQQGAVCVVAAGNSGPDMYTVGSPAAAQLAITVGASDKYDSMASFSSTGPTADYRIKPDDVAPGVDIVAARATGTSLGTPVSEYYTKISGTSMATPHVSGAAALLLDAHPSWSPAQIKGALSNYAKDLGSNVLQQGSGRIDVCKAATASIVGNSSVSFGTVSMNTIYTSNVMLQNLGDHAISANLAVETWLIGDGTRYPVVSLSTSSLYFSQGAVNSVQLRLNTGASLPSGYFEGKVTITFDSLTIRIPFFFCIVAQVNVEVVNERGTKLMAAFSIIDAATGQMKTFSSEASNAHFTVTQGTYIIQAMNIYGWEVSGSIDASTAFVIHQKFSVGKDETKNLQLSLASAYKVVVRTTDVNGASMFLKLKQILTPYYTMFYRSEIGALGSQSIYLTNVSQYLKPPSFFGFMGFSPEDAFWSNGGILTSEVDAYFIGWDLSTFGLTGSLTSLDYTNSDLASLHIGSVMPKPTTISGIWFNQIAGLWQSGFWQGFKTYPGITWNAHILPYHYKQNQAANYTDLEWSCIYTMSANFNEGPEYFVIDRHFEPISKGETSVYNLGTTPLLPQRVYENPSYYGNGLYIPYYPLIVEKNQYLGKTNTQTKKIVESVKNDQLISNETRPWANDAVPITQTMLAHGYGVYSFTVKTETTLTYSSKNTAKYVINYASSSTDLLPPALTQMNAQPCLTDNVYHVTLRFTDNDAITSVTLKYSLDDGSWTQASLQDQGQGSFSSDIPVPPGSQKISLTAEAYDRNGNSMSYTAEPVATKGYKTQTSATLNSDGISGRLIVIGGSLLQQVFLTVRSGGLNYYTLTNLDGSFGFSTPPSMIYPVQIEMPCMGNFEESSITLNAPQGHDVAITRIVPSKTVASGNVTIDVTVANLGSYVETFTVSARANNTVVQTQTVTMDGQTSTTLILVWNTAGFQKGVYKIGAYADLVPFEMNTTNNSLDDGFVRLSLLGDLNGDGSVDIFDALILASAYNSNPSSPNWNPNADLNGDGRVDLFDALLMASNYGRTG